MTPQCQDARKTFPHAFATRNGSPAVIGEISVAEYMCVCGTLRGTYEEIARHIFAEDTAVVPALSVDTAVDTAVVAPTAVPVDDFSGGHTKAYYLPNAPRKPASPSELPTESSRSIAESFQDMLRESFTAGLSAALNGETFEIWYQREVLQ